MQELMLYIICMLTMFINITKHITMDDNGKHEDVSVCCMESSTIITPAVCLLIVSRSHLVLALSMCGYSTSSTP